MDIIHKYWKIIIAIGIIACFFFLIVAFSKNLFPEFLPLENISNNMTNISEVAPPAYLSPIIAINSNRREG